MGAPVAARMMPDGMKALADLLDDLGLIFDDRTEELSPK
jgi:hypothetical protein